MSSRSVTLAERYLYISANQVHGCMQMRALAHFDKKMLMFKIVQNLLEEHEFKTLNLTVNPLAVNICEMKAAQRISTPNKITSLIKH